MYRPPVLPASVTGQVLQLNECVVTAIAGRIHVKSMNCFEEIKYELNVFLLTRIIGKSVNDT